MWAHTLYQGDDTFGQTILMNNVLNRYENSEEMEELVDDNDSGAIQVEREINFLDILTKLMDEDEASTNEIFEMIDTLQIIESCPKDGIDENEEFKIPDFDAKQHPVSNDDTTQADITDGDNDPDEENIAEEYFTNEDEFNLRQEASSLKHSQACLDDRADNVSSGTTTTLLMPPTIAITKYPGSLDHLPFYHQGKYADSNQEIDDIGDDEEEEEWLEIGQEESGQSSIVTMYERPNYGVSEADQDVAEEMVANKLVIDLDNSTTLSSINKKNTTTIPVTDDSPEMLEADVEHQHEVGVRFVTCVDIQGPDTMEDTNEEKKVIKVEAKEIDNSVKLGNSEHLREDNKKDAEVKNIKDINNKNSIESHIDTPVDVNNNDRGSETLEDEQSNKIIEISEPHFLTLFLSCFGCMKRRKY